MLVLVASAAEACAAYLLRTREGVVVSGTVQRIPDGNAKMVQKSLGRPEKPQVKLVIKTMGVGQDNRSEACSESTPVVKE